MKGRINHNPSTGQHCCISSGLSLPLCVSPCCTMFQKTQKCWNRVILERAVYTQIVDLMALNKIPCLESGSVLSPPELHGWLQKKSGPQGPEAARSCALKFKVQKWGRTKEHRVRKGQKGHRVVCKPRGIKKKHLHNWSKISSFMVHVKLEPTWEILFNQTEIRKHAQICRKFEMWTPPNFLFL